MTNLLQETIEYLKYHGHTLDDIKFIMSNENNYYYSLQKTVQENFYAKVNAEILKNILNVNYDSGYGSQNINRDLKLVGDDFWLERHEYDGSEWWEFKKFPEYKSEFEVPATEVAISDDDREYYREQRELNLKKPDEHTWGL